MTPRHAWMVPILLVGCGYSQVFRPGPGGGPSMPFVPGSGNCDLTNLGPADEPTGLDEVLAQVGAPRAIDLAEDTHQPPFDPWALELTFEVEVVGTVTRIALTPHEDWPPVCTPGEYFLADLETRIRSSAFTGEDGTGRIVWQADVEAPAVYFGEGGDVAIAPELHDPLLDHLVANGTCLRDDDADAAWHVEAGDGFLADIVHLESGAGRVVPWPGGDVFLSYSAMHCGSIVGRWTSD